MIDNRYDTVYQHGQNLLTTSTSTVQSDLLWQTSGTFQAKVQ